MSDLVERLRASVPTDEYDHDLVDALFIEAADALAACEAKLAASTPEEVEALIKRLTAWREVGSDNSQMATDLLDAAALLRRLSVPAGVVEALEACSSPFTIGTEAGLIDFETLAREFNRRQHIAKATLSALRQSKEVERG